MIQDNSCLVFKLIIWTKTINLIVSVSRCFVHTCSQALTLFIAPRALNQETDVRVPDQTFPRQNQEDFGILSTDGVAHSR